MTYVTGTITFGVTGTKNVALGIAPKGVRCTIAGKPSDTVSHMSVGSYDGTNQVCASTFADTTGAASFRTSSKIVSHYDRVSGSITEVVAGTATALNATGVVFNVTAANTNYSIDIEAWD